MTHFPSLEEMLSQIRQSIGLELHPQEKRFTDFELNLENHTKLTQEVLDEIFTALNMDELDRRDASKGLTEWFNFHKAFELNAYTGNASQRQVLWHMLAYSYAPALARRLAFWSMANTQYGLAPIDAGMSGGKFWFLPHIDDSSGKLEMPVAQVMNWLLDLLDGTSVKILKGSVGNKNLRADDESVIRTLYNWRKNGLPKSANKIDTVFPDDSTLCFDGTFKQNKNLTIDEIFDDALSFISTKQLSNPENLQHEIPINKLRLKAILSGSATDEDKKEFIEKITIRYQIPTMNTIRKRLKVARMMQDGYTRLLKFLCPDVNIDCTNPAKNKLLQIIGLFDTIYNLTIKAYENADSLEDQDAWFESNLPPWDTDLLISILPSQFGNGYLLLAERLTRIFISLEPNSPLENLVPWNKESTGPIIKRRLLIIKQQYDEDIKLEKLRKRVRIASPWRTLLQEDNLWVLRQFALQIDLSPKIQTMVLIRMREIAKTEADKVSVNLLELDYLLNREPSIRTIDTKHRVQKLIDESIHSAGYDEWKAPLLQFRAQHSLLQNDFISSIKDYKAALKACLERSFGSLRGEIARDGFAVDLFKKGINSKTQSIYYRHILGYMQFSYGAPTFDEAVVECQNYFWDNLYHPYTGIEKVTRKLKVQK